MLTITARRHLLAAVAAVAGVLVAAVLLVVGPWSGASNTRPSIGSGQFGPAGAMHTITAAGVKDGISKPLSRKWI